MNIQAMQSMQVARKSHFVGSKVQNSASQTFRAGSTGVVADRKAAAMLKGLLVSISGDASVTASVA